MLEEKKNNTNIGVGLGIVTQIVGQVLQSQGGAMGTIGLVVSLGGLALFVWGCFNYAEGKGYSPFLGLLGLLSCLGLIILVILPDKHK